MLAGGTSFPITVEVVTDSLYVHIHDHTVPTYDGEVISCWSYLTAGMWKHGQKELALTLRRDSTQPVEAFPRVLLTLFEQVHQLAVEGAVVDAWGFTQLGAPIVYEFQGLVYVPGIAHGPLRFEAPTLTALLLTKDEAAVVQRFGALRILSRLGMQHSHYPFPSWSDGARPPLDAARLLTESVLARVPCLSDVGMSAMVSGEMARLRLARSTATELRAAFAQLPMDAPLALLLELAPEADSCLVWEPGQTQPTAIAAPESDNDIVSACYVGFVPQQEYDAAVLFEDGVMVHLTDMTWARLRSALARGEPLTIEPNGRGYGFALSWTEPAR